MHVAVCIVAFANPADVRHCLEALARSTHRNFEVVICENGGEEAHRRLAEALPLRLVGGQRVTTLNAPDNPGYAGGVNRCLAATPDADAWWVLNPDTTPEPEALTALVARLAKGDVDAVGGLLLNGSGKVQTLGGGRWRGWLARVETIGPLVRADRSPVAGAIEPQLDFISGASMLIGRRFLAAAGPMREDYFLYCEEVEWCLRAKRAGLRMGFAPEARVGHAQGTTTGWVGGIKGRSQLAIYLDERNRLNLVRDLDPARFAPVALSALAMLTLRFARHGAWREWRHALAGWRAGLRNERGKPEWLAGR